MFFSESIAQLRAHGGRFAGAGVRLACIVQAHPRQIAEVCDSGGAFECIPDPRRESHRALGIGRLPLWRLFTARDLWKRRKQALAAGHRQDWRRTFARESDGLLLPAAALVAPGGKILWLHRGEHTGDLPGVDAMLAVAQEHWDPKSSEQRPFTS